MTVKNLLDTIKSINTWVTIKKGDQLIFGGRSRKFLNGWIAKCEVRELVINNADDITIVIY